MKKIINIIKESAVNIHEMLATHRIYFVIGDTQIDLLSYKNKNFIERYSCAISDISNDLEFQKFLERNKRSNAKFIINSKEITLEHETLPIIDTLGKIDPIEKYCATHLHSGDIYSYKVYSIIKDRGEVWKGVICWIPLTETIRKCLYLIQENSIYFEAIYFYNFIAQQIASDIATANEITLNDYIYTIISVSKSSGVVITLNHQGNILSDVRCDYPTDKSLEYLQGVIEQNISDIWLKFTKLTSDSEIKKANIFLVSDNLKHLLSKPENKVECNLFAINSAGEHQDEITTIIKYFCLNTQREAVSTEIKAYQRYQFVNSLFFIPYCAVMLFMLGYIAYLTLSVYQLDRSTSELYNNYSKTSEEIRQKAHNFPEIANISQLADLYNLQNQLTQKKSTPFPLLQDFLSNVDKSLELKKISWSLDEYSSSFRFFIDIEADRSNKKDILAKIKTSIDHLKMMYTNINIDLQILSNVNNEDQSSLEQIFRIYGSGR